MLQRLALLPLLLLCWTHRASADYAETERRLKAVGIEEALRSRIHAAIDRGVTFLVEHQGEHGSWMPATSRLRSWRIGVTALCALALRHAGTRATRQPVREALRFLMGPDGKGRKRVLNGTYTGGITTMLLAADHSHPGVARAITLRIAASQRRSTGWWGYRLGTAESSASLSHSDLSNLSTSQFAALGLWAGARSGAATAPEVWRRVLVGMIHAQTKTGSWNYYPTKPKGRTGYPTGTFMGMANLLLARSALRSTLAADPALAKKTIAARLRGVEAMRREGRAFLESFEPGASQAYTSSYYTLYALEKACIFLGVETLGGLPWYRSGAESLLDRQNPDGGWSPGGFRQPRGRGAGHVQSDFLSTSFALLFLLRSSEAYRPEHPSRVDRKGPVVTGK